MILYPTIDLKDGRCVRLKRGEMAEATVFFFSSRRRHTSFSRDWSSDVCSSDLGLAGEGAVGMPAARTPRAHADWGSGERDDEALGGGGRLGLEGGGDGAGHA